ncbi:MAG: Hpt domain-containing protein [Nitrosotalea sp.]
MSDEFLRVARQEIQTEIENLKDIFLFCGNDEQLHEKSVDIEKHMHKIKGLAPMMGQEKVGEIARISDIILKHVTNHGVLKGSHSIISNAVQRMSSIFSGQISVETDDFKKTVKDAYPQILGF